jgi:hypothetical protein
MKHVWRALTLAAVVGAALTPVRPAIAQAPAAAPTEAPASLVIGGDVTQPLSLQPAELKSMPRTTVTVTEEGREIKYEGVLVGELLKRAGAPVGRDLSGKAIATYVREREGRLPGRLLAGRTGSGLHRTTSSCRHHRRQAALRLPGPLRIVAPHDKRGARSIRMLQRIEVVRLVK